MEIYQDVFTPFLKFGFMSIFFIMNNIDFGFIAYIFSFILAYCFCKCVSYYCKKLANFDVTDVEIGIQYSFFTIPLLFLLSGYIGVLFVTFLVIPQWIFVLFLYFNNK